MLWYEVLIRNILWATFFAGIWMIFYPYIVKTAKEKIKKRSRLSIERASVKKEKAYITTIRQFIGAAIGKDSAFAAYTLIFILVLSSVFSLTILKSTGRTPLEIMLGMVSSPAIIIGFLFYRLRQMRVKTSHEGKYLINELLNNYRINHKNIIEAIEQSVYSLKNQPSAKALMANLAISLKEIHDNDDLRSAVDEINYRINSKWALLLSNLIYAAVKDGDDITEGLIDLSKDLAELDQINEKNKQINLEGTIMIYWFIPAIILGGLYFVFKYAGFTLDKYIEYQFVNDIGFTMFYYSAMSVSVTFLIFLFLRKEKNDF